MYGNLKWQDDLKYKCYYIKQVAGGASGVSSNTAHSEKETVKL